MNNPPAKPGLTMPDTKKNQFFFLWLFIVLVNLLVLGPVGWIAKSYHKELKEIEAQLHDIEETKIGRDEFKQCQKDTGGRLNTLETRLYDSINRQIPVKTKSYHKELKEDEGAQLHDNR